MVLDVMKLVNNYISKKACYNLSFAHTFYRNIKAEVLPHLNHTFSSVRHISNSYISNKRGFVQIIPPSWGLSYQFDWHTINRSRRHQNDMTRPIQYIICTKPSFSICNCFVTRHTTY